MSLDIRVIGKGCFFCDQLLAIVKSTLSELGVADATVMHVEDVGELLEFGVVNPPALVVNGKLKLMGRVLVRSRVRRAIEEELQSVASAPEAAGKG